MRVTPLPDLSEYTNKTNPQDNQRLSPSSSTSPIDDIEDSPESISTAIGTDDKVSAESLQAGTDEDSHESIVSQHHILRPLRTRPRTLAVSSVPIET